MGAARARLLPEVAEDVALLAQVTGESFDDWLAESTWRRSSLRPAGKFGTGYTSIDDPFGERIRRRPDSDLPGRGVGRCPLTARSEDDKKTSSTVSKVGRVMQQTTRRIGVVGLGAMGGRITSRLLSLGYEVYGTNRTRTKADALIRQGLIWRDSPRETAQSADIVISMVTDSAALKAVTAGPDGILAGLSAGTIYLDMSTVSPQTSRGLAHRVTSRGAAMLAAPVSGSLPAAEQGSLAVIAGGDPGAFESVEPILRQLGRTVTFVGDNGHALLLKLAINISLGVQMLAFSEGLLLAERGGVERQVALDVLMRSAIGSPMLEARAPLLLELPDQAWFDVAQMQKDIRLALDSARDLKVPLPSTAVTDDVLTTARTKGYAHRDIAVVLRVLSEMAAGPGDRELESATT